MDAELIKLIQHARKTQLTDADREAQRISFAYGNSKMENEDITRDTVIRQSAKLKADQKKPA